MDLTPVQVEGMELVTAFPSFHPGLQGAASHHQRFLVLRICRGIQSPRWSWHRE